MKRQRPLFNLSLLIALIVTAGLLPDWIQYGMFYVGGDFSNQQIPFIIETKRMFSSGVPFWSWNTYFGQNFIASYSFYTLTSPFVWINCLFPYNAIPASITLTLYLKFICTGIATFLYLNEMSISERMSFAGSLLYVFSSFVISNVNYYHFFEPLICFPLLLLALEHFIKGKKRSFSLLIGISFVTAFVNWYFIPCSFIAAAIYVACRIWGRDGQHLPLKKTLMAIVAVTVGVLMSSVILFPTLFHLIGNSRAHPSVSFKFDSYECLLWLQQIRSLFVPKVGEVGNSSPWIFNTFASSAASLPLLGVSLPFFYVLRKRDWLSLLIVVSVIVFITPLNGVFSLFTNPGYSRWAYAISLFFVLASVKYLDGGWGIENKQLLIYTVIAVAVYLFFRFPVYWMRIKGMKVSADEGCLVDLCILMVFGLNLILLFFYQRKQSWERLIVLISVFSCCHLSVQVLERTDWFFSHSNQRLLNVFQSYVNADIPIAGNSPMSYRTDFLTREDVVYANMALLKNQPSVSTYNSVKDKNLGRLFATVDTSVKTQNHFVPTRNRTSFDALMSVKYIIDFKDSAARQEMVEGKTLLFDSEQYSEYCFDYYIPMGFTYDSYMPESEFIVWSQNNAAFDQPKQMLANLVVADEDIPVVAGCLRKGVIVPDNFPLDSLVQTRRRTVCSSFAGDTRGFKATINLDRSSFVFFSVLADPGFTAYIDGVRGQIIKANFGLSAVQVPSGAHQIEFRYLPPGLLAGAAVSLLTWIIFLLSFFISPDFKRCALSA